MLGEVMSLEWNYSASILKYEDKPWISHTQVFSNVTFQEQTRNIRTSLLWISPFVDSIWMHTIKLHDVKHCFCKKGWCLPRLSSHGIKHLGLFRSSIMHAPWRASNTQLWAKLSTNNLEGCLLLSSSHRRNLWLVLIHSSPFCVFCLGLNSLNTGNL